MLGKLIKNEFKATGRTFGVMYLIVLAVTVIMKAFMEIQSAFNIENTVMTIISSLTVFSFVVGILAVIFGTFILILKRFYDSMLKDEGYLTFTLPATVGQHITSKSIVSYIWIVVSIVFVLVNFIILCLGHADVFVAMKKEFIDIIDILNKQHLWKYVIEVIIALVIALFNYIIIGYACFSVGQAWSRHKIAGALATYIVFNIITEIVSSIVVVILFGNMEAMDNINMGDALFQPLMIFTIVEQVIVAILCIVVTNIMLSRKLNLE